MKKKISCGSSCVKYVINDLLNSTSNINPKMFWITEMALCLTKYLDNDIKLYCYNSNLYDDYKKNPNKNFAGFTWIKEYLKSNLIIYQKELTRKNLKTEIDDCEFLILCVESKLLNNNDLMSGGHYIIISKIENNIVSIINPQKNKYEFKEIELDDLISYSSNFGSWRILIKKIK